MVVLVALAAPADGGQLQQGTVRGTVRGPDGIPVAGTLVRLVDALGEPLAETTTGPGGNFQLTDIPPGTYALRADAPPLHAFAASVVIGGALPVDIDLRMSAVASEQVLVRGDEEIEPGSTTTRVTLGGDSVRRAPARLRSRGLQDAIATTPGWATEDNGLLHVRGVDDGFLYVIDGVPVYERIDGLFGVSPDPALVDAVTVSTGYIPPEFGFKAGGVIEVRSAVRAAEAWTAALDGSAGNDETRGVSVVAGGPAGSTGALTVGVASQASSRFLDPVHPDNIHNDGATTSGGAQFGWLLPRGGTLNLVSGFGASDFDVPHGEEQEEAGQDQRQRVRQGWITSSWQRVWSSNAVSQVSGYYRHGSSALIGSDADTPLFTNADRSLWRAGVLATITRQAGRHLLKFGGEAARLGLREQFLFAVADDDDAEEAGLSDEAMAFTRENPFTFEGSAEPTLFSLYVQDSFRPVDHFTIDAGVRFDWSRMLTAASHVSPRVGASYRWNTGTTLRGSFGRFFQPPQAENLLLSSSEAARALSPFLDETGGGAALPPERQTAFEAGLEQIVWGTARVDLAVWHRRVRDAADPNVFFGSTIIFPNSIAEGYASGVDVRLEIPRRAGWSGYVSYANSRVEQVGPVTGGLFLEEEVIEIGPGTRFTPDHDQRHVTAAGVTYDHERTGFWTSLTARYESGTPLEVEDDELDELRERPGAGLIDIERGRVKPRTILDVAGARRILQTARADVSLRLSLLNLTGKRWAYNFGNPFSGTHFGPGRTVQVGVRASFR